MSEPIDSLGLREATFGLPEQMAAAVRSLPVTGPLPDHDEIANVLVLGTGAAGWAGALVEAVAGPFMPVPLVVHRGFEPPSFVDRSTLVIAISASGDSPEVVASAGLCVEAGARLEGRAAAHANQVTVRTSLIFGLRIPDRGLEGFQQRLAAAFKEQLGAEV